MGLYSSSSSQGGQGTRFPLWHGIGGSNVAVASLWSICPARQRRVSCLIRAQGRWVVENINQPTLNRTRPRESTSTKSKIAFGCVGLSFWFFGFCVCLFWGRVGGVIVGSIKTLSQTGLLGSLLKEGQVPGKPWILQDTKGVCRIFAVLPRSGLVGGVWISLP